MSAPSDGPEGVDARLFVGSLAEGLALLSAIAAAGRPLGVSEAAALTGLDRSSGQRLLYALRVLSFLRQEDGSRRYLLGARVLDLAHGYLQADALWRVAQATFATLQGVLGPIRGGALRALGVTAPECITQLPDVRTFAETVAPGFSADGWYGLSGPAGLPDSVAARLAEANMAAMQDPAVRDRLIELGFRVTAMDAAEFTRFVQEEVRKLAAVVRISGARAE